MELFSRKQTAKMLGVSLSTLDNLRQERSATIRSTLAARCSLHRHTSTSTLNGWNARIENPRSEESRRVKSDENRDDIRD